MTNYETRVGTAPEIRRFIEQQFTFFDPEDLQQISKQLLSARMDQKPVTLIAIRCPWMDDMPSLIPYADDYMGTVVRAPSKESKRVTDPAKRINTTIHALSELGIASTVALLVSNIQPHAYRLRDDHPDVIGQAPEPISEYLHATLNRVMMRSTISEIEHHTTTHAQQIREQIADAPVTIYNHIEVASKILASDTEKPIEQTFTKLLARMSEFNLDWDWRQDPETFLEALYTFDLVHLPKLLRNDDPFIWINMQPERDKHSYILGNVLKSCRPFPFIKGFQYETNLYE